MDDIRPLVLVVDDDQSLMVILRVALDQLGFNGVFAPDADEAAALLDLHDPAIVLCDFELPGTLSAADLYALVNERTAARFILMTGHRANNVLAHLPTGTLLLQKPFRLATLGRVLREALPEAASAG